MIQLKEGQYTIKNMVQECANLYKNSLALTTYKKPETSLTFSKLEAKARTIATFLVGNKVEKGTTIAILSESCPNWGLSYFAINIAGAIAVPILPNFSKEEVQKILNHSEAKFVFVNSANAKKVEGSKARVIRIEDMSYISQKEMRNLNDISFENLKGLSIENEIILPEDEAKLAQQCPNEDDIASIIYTSGTTGTPKGVMLTNKNLVWNAVVCSKPFIKIHKGWKALSILPLSHVYEFTIGLLLILMNGASVTYLGKAPSVGSLMPALKEVKPEIMLTVPLLIEKVYRRAIQPKFKEGTRLNKLMQHRMLQKPIYHLIGKKIIKTFGGKMKFFGIGGSKLDPQVEEFLAKANFPYALGYGLTETSPFIAGCGPKDHKVGTLGKVLDGLDVRISPEDGEIQIKGPTVMKGYFKMPELTKEVFTEDGYFCTGDLGAFEKGRLAIKGRSKSLILGANGENIYPDTIETLINAQEYVIESLVIPENMSLTAMVRLDLQAIQRALGSINIQEFLEQLKQNINLKLSTFSKINNIRLQEEPFERTPTEKIKRYLYTKAI